MAGNAQNARGGGYDTSAVQDPVGSPFARFGDMTQDPMNNSATTNGAAGASGAGPGIAPGGAAADAHPGRRFFVRFAIAATAATFIGMTSLLYYFWWMRPVGASALIMVMGDESWEGTVVRVMGPQPPDRVEKLEASGGYATRFSLPPGTYALEMERGGRTIFRQDLVRLKEGTPIQVDLRAFRPPGGAGAAGAVGGTGAAARPPSSSRQSKP